VVTFGWSGAWGELRAVDTDELAVLPVGLDAGAAAALPVAAVTALRALRRLGAVIGRRVLVTGASGGVGRFAVQLADRAGAHVIALAGSPERAEGLLELGAAEVVFGLDAIDAPVDAVLENVGGQLLADTLDRLAPGGVVMSIGMASLEPSTIDFERMRQRAGGARIEAFTVGSAFREDLTHLVGLVHADALDPQIGWRGSWHQVQDAAGALLGRRVRGKAVLEVTG
jgi:NADPH2:quinone reductase